LAARIMHVQTGCVMVWETPVDAQTDVTVHVVKIQVCEVYP